MPGSSPLLDPDELADALARIERGTQVMSALSLAATEAGVVRADEFAYVIRTVMRQVSRLVQLETELADQTPAAAPYLQTVTDSAARWLAAVAITTTARTMIADVDRQG